MTEMKNTASDSCNAVLSVGHDVLVLGARGVVPDVVAPLRLRDRPRLARLHARAHGAVGGVLRGRRERRRRRRGVVLLPLRRARVDVVVERVMRRVVERNNNCVVDRPPALLEPTSRRGRSDAAARRGGDARPRACEEREEREERDERRPSAHGALCGRGGAPTRSFRSPKKVSSILVRCVEARQTFFTHPTV
eukprot:30931-Pelagococcus_subviridis.AAC.17